MALLRIPAMSDWIAPGLGDAQRDALIDEALKDLDPRECVQVNWFVVHFRRLADDVPTG